MHNLDVRTAMKQAGIFGYQLAAALGIAETSFSRMLARKELSEEDKGHVLRTIAEISKARTEEINANANY